MKRKADFKDEANKAKRLMMKQVDEGFKTQDIPSIEILIHYMKEFSMKSEKLHTNPQARPNKQR
jgi:tagatose-1,6-bisphosphate aldolase